MKFKGSHHAPCPRTEQAKGAKRKKAASSCSTWTFVVQPFDKQLNVELAY